MRVKCLAQEHSAVNPGLEPGPFDPGLERVNEILDWCIRVKG